MFCSLCGNVMRKQVAVCWSKSPYRVVTRGLSTATYLSTNGKNPASWVNLLYQQDASSTNQVHQLKSQLNAALTAKRSSERGDLMPYVVARDLVSFYNGIDEMEDKAAFFHLLSQKLGTDSTAVSESMAKLQTAIDEKNRNVPKYQFHLKKSLVPAYELLFNDISKLQNGVQFLVNMRKDLLLLYRRKILQKTPTLVAFDTYLKEHLAVWFWNGFLDLNVVSWSNSSGEMLQKVMQYEAVHAMCSWDDLKLRASASRRIFTFTHRLMPDEPLVILHTLLAEEIPDNIQNVINRQPRFDYEYNKEKVTSAVFYSISTTQRGLDGIALGSFLIKRVVEHLRREYHNMNTFVTLSPVPGFRKWLEFQFKCISQSAEIPPLLTGLNFDIHKVKEILSSDDWRNDEVLQEYLRKPLMQICARYLLQETRRGFAIDSVAHFHLRNGACLWRMNWLGNTNDNGFQSSYGLMVNYKYNLDEIEENNRSYIMEGKIAYSDQVRQLIE